jgi:hypothetical protein
VATNDIKGAESTAVDLPKDVQVVWDPGKAYHETTPTRERISLNGLWQWQPAEVRAKEVPDGNWGYFKVPGCWPGITDYMQKDCQTVHFHPRWRTQRLGVVTAAWYQREITIPKQWTGRRIFVSFDYLNSYASVHLDGRQVGEARFPGGQVEVTSALNEPGVHRLSLLVIALPLKGVMLSYTDSASAREQQGSVARRGLCGDVYLVSTPPGARLTDVRVETSVQAKKITINAGIESLAADRQYTLRARVLDGTNSIKEFTSPAFHASDLQQDRFSFTQSWLPERLWDIDTPQNQYDLEVTLADRSGANLDTSWTVRFGFRELWIDGRNFFLNGTRIFLSAVPIDNAQISALLATYDRARESLQRLKSFGINFVYTHNYSCTPGAHLGFDEVLRAADDLGMLVSFSQPHFSHYDWKAGNADEANGYARHASYYVRVAQNHPSVVMYSMSHNATGYDEDMNPDMIDGIHEARDSWALNNVALAKRAEAIVHHLDPSRIVYHHASGNLGPMHVINFYPNFVPIQELSDWFGHWSAQGVKPAFMCEYGAPFSWDWTMYRGWYKGQREFGSAAVPWEFCLAEWNAQFLGDRAFAISDAEKRNLRWEAQQFRAGKLWHRWDYPVQVGSSRLEERYPVFAMYLKDNWRAFRTWEVSGISPWEFELFWKLRDGADRKRQEFKTDWQNLQRPGFSPDYEDERYERMDLTYQRSDWEPTAAARALIDNNRQLLAYIGGKPEAFTSKDHTFLPGETISKQLILINNSRATVTADCQWTFRGDAHDTHIEISPGQQNRIPITIKLPEAGVPSGTYELDATARFSTSEVQTDSFAVNIVAQPQPVSVEPKISLFDPKGETTALLIRLGIHAQSVEASRNLSGYDILIVGKAALTPEGAAPDISGVREGLKVILFEQTAPVLEKRLGFRVEEYGLRQVFPRIPDHPALGGLGVALLHDWRGEATLLPRQLQYQARPQYGPTVEWCGLRVPHLWRCGNRGNVASVLIEKPVQGDFLPIVDGGYSLQFSPLLEYKEGKGLVLFCQMDVTGRNEPEPAADILVRNLLAYVAAWKPAPRREALYVGEPVGKEHLAAVGISAGPYDRAKLTVRQVLVAGPGSGKLLSGDAPAIAAWLKVGGKLLAIDFPQDELNSILPHPVAIKTAEHISAFFEPLGLNSFAAGIGPADLHNRDPRDLPLVSGGAQIIADGVLGQSEAGAVVLCQMAPWQFSDTQPNLKRTRRRASFVLSRLLANLGVSASSPLLDHFHNPPESTASKGRWLTGLYIDQPQEWDDPYRHFRW